MRPIPPITEKIKRRMAHRTKKSLNFPDCVEWERYDDGYDTGCYDRIRVGSDVFSVSRVNYFLATGEQHLDGRLRRTCANPRCVKGEHFEPVKAPRDEPPTQSSPPVVVKVLSVVEGAHVEVGQTWTQNVVTQLKFSRTWPPSRLVRFTKRKVIEDESQ